MRKLCAAAAATAVCWDINFCLIKLIPLELSTPVNN